MQKLQTRTLNAADVAAISRAVMYNEYGYGYCKLCNCCQNHDEPDHFDYCPVARLEGVL